MGHCLFWCTRYGYVVVAVNGFCLFGRPGMGTWYWLSVVTYCRCVFHADMSSFLPCLWPGSVERFPSSITQWHIYNNASIVLLITSHACHALRSGSREKMLISRMSHSVLAVSWIQLVERLRKEGMDNIQLTLD